MTYAIDTVLADIRQRFSDRISAWHETPAKEAEWAPFPGWVPAQVRSVLSDRGIEQLYSHQQDAAELVHGGRHVVVVTPTASGKTLCYNLPVLSALVDDPTRRALYIFPTKALAQDQLAEVHGLIDQAGLDLKTYTYDGDTPASARRAIRSAGHIVVTNPDMLHTGILPHHTKWVRLFENLRYVVIDEMHTYRGVFGSHVANVIRRLRRIAAFYGAEPQFVLCSATIANPGELASQLIGDPVVVVDRNGAPRAAKCFALYNPPVVNAQLGIRRSYILETRSLAMHLLRQDIPTIVFARSRLVCEVLLSYLQEANDRLPGKRRRIRGYRGGYLPSERREIERGLRDGTITGVVATNALELGVDIGQLDACVMAGYPGSIASSWQQAGRAGRRAGMSFAVLVADSSPLNQFMVTHPDYFFGASPEQGLINPGNPLIAVNHLKCAAYELPFEAGEAFAGSTDDTQEQLGYLARQGLLHSANGRWHWMAESFPAEAISLRSAATDNFVIIDTSEPKPQVLGEIDRFSVPTLLHEDAIYIHEGRQFHVDRLDWEEAKAYVRRVDVDHYTDAELAVKLTVLDEFEQSPLAAPAMGVGAAGPQARSARGEVQVQALATIYKKIRFGTHENVGWGQISLPEQEMHTASWWLAFPGTGASPPDERSKIEGALVGISTVLHQVAAIHLMCDARDLGTTVEIKSPHTKAPTIFMYDRYPGGIGLCDRAYEIAPRLLHAAWDLIRDCACASGCPSCVGAAAESGTTSKAGALGLLREVLDLVAT